MDLTVTCKCESYILPCARARYHLANATDLDLLPGARELAAEMGIKNWKPVKTAVFVGAAKGIDSSLVLKDGPKVRTLWGYIACRLAGDAGLKVLREAEANGSNPGSEKRPPQWAASFSPAHSSRSA